MGIAMIASIAKIAGILTPIMEPSSLAGHGDMKKSGKNNGVEWGKRSDKPGVKWGDMGCEWGGMG
jgi:hypothetical protein